VSDRLPSHVQITNLLHVYAELMDAGRLEECADLFADARILTGGPGGGVLDRDGLLALWRDIVILHDDGTPRTRHVTTNPIIDVDEKAGTATCRSVYTVLQQIDDGPLAPILSGRYHDRFERVDGTWRFAERDYAMVDLVGDVSRHVRLDLG